jgi:hypothetical protein
VRRDHNDATSLDHFGNDLASKIAHDDIAGAGMKINHEPDKYVVTPAEGLHNRLRVIGRAEAKHLGSVFDRTALYRRSGPFKQADEVYCNT